MERGIYILIGYKEGVDSTPTVIFPQEDCDAVFVRVPKLYKDFKDVEKFIKEKIGLKFNRIMVVKLIEDLEPKLNDINYEQNYCKITAGLC